MHSLPRSCEPPAECSQGDRGGVYTQDCEERGRRGGLGKTSHLEALRDWREGAEGSSVASGSPQEDTSIWCALGLSPCRRASKEIREPAALAKVLGEGIKCVKGPPGSAKSQTQL